MERFPTAEERRQWWSGGSSAAPQMAPKDPATGSAASGDPLGSAHAAPAKRHKNIAAEGYYKLPDGICVNDDDPIPTSQSRWTDGRIKDHAGGRLDPIPSHFHAMIARSMTRMEVQKIPKAVEAVNTEWNKLRMKEYTITENGKKLTKRGGHGMNLR